MAVRGAREQVLASAPVELGWPGPPVPGHELIHSLQAPQTPPIRILMEVSIINSISNLSLLWGSGRKWEGAGKCQASNHGLREVSLVASLIQEPTYGVTSLEQKCS